MSVYVSKYIIGNPNVLSAFLQLIVTYVGAAGLAAMVGLHFVVQTYWVECKVCKNYVEKYARQPRFTYFKGDRVRWSKTGGTRWRSWLRYCATSRKVAGSIPDGVMGIFH